MRTCRLFLTAVVSAGAVAFLGSPLRADDASNTSNNNQSAAQRAENGAENAANRAGNATGNAMQRTGGAIERGGERLSNATTNPSNAMAPDADDIRGTLASATEASVTKNGFDDLVERFSKADRDRLGKEMHDQFTKDPTLNGRIAEFQKDWKAKYNKEFDIDKRNEVYDQSFAVIRQGELPGFGSARMAAERQTGEANAPANTGEVNTNTNNTNEMNKTENRTNQNVASVTVLPDHNLPGVTVPMVHEAIDSWKIDVPDNVTAKQLHDNLLTQLTTFDEQKDQWPSDPKEAYRMATHHVLMAVMNTNEQGELQNTTSGNPANNARTPGAAQGSDNGQ